MDVGWLVYLDLDVGDIDPVLCSMLFSTELDAFIRLWSSSLANAIITTVILSYVLLLMLSLRTDSTALETRLCNVAGYFWLGLVRSSQIVRITSPELILSNIPSHANIKKSWSDDILKDLISGSAITTFGLQPNYSNFASISPNVRDTDNLPGKTLNGPMIILSSSVPAGADVWYILPPPYYILYYSYSSHGLWSLDNEKTCLPLEALNTALESPTFPIKH